MVFKLKYEHLQLTLFSKMRVDLAAQDYDDLCQFFIIILILYTPLSESVGKALQLTGGTDVQETAKFAIMFDKFFDCLSPISQTGLRLESHFKNRMIMQMIQD